MLSFLNASKSIAVYSGSVHNWAHLVNSTANSYAIQSAGRLSNFVLRHASEKLSHIGRNTSRKNARSF